MTAQKDGGQKKLAPTKVPAGKSAKDRRDMNDPYMPGDEAIARALGYGKPADSESK